MMHIIELDSDKLLDYTDSARGIIALPPGNYRMTDPIRWNNVTLCSADPKRPAVLDSVLVFGNNVMLDSLQFAAMLVPDELFKQPAITLRGMDCTVQRCEVLNGAKFGIIAEKRALIRWNTIFGFSDDGIQFCGNETQIIQNTIGYLQLQEGADHAHHDCIQGWAGDPDTPFRSAERYDAKHTLEDVTIQGNHLMDVPDSPLQGITFFDGLADRWDVSGNVIHLRGPHPLTIRGLLSGTIDNNSLMPGSVECLPPARQWLANVEKWREVTELTYQFA